MSRHRNIRNRAYSYDEDYFDEDDYDDDYYDGAPGSPTSSQYVWSGSAAESQNLSSFVLDSAIGNIPKQDPPKLAATPPSTTTTEPAVDPRLLLDLQIEVENMIGQQVKLDLIKEAGRECNYDSDAMTTYVLESIANKEASKPSQIKIVPPSAVGKKVHVFRSTSAPEPKDENTAKGSALGEALTASATANPPPGLSIAASVSDSFGQHSGVKPFDFSEPSPDDVQSSRAGRKKPVIKAKQKASIAKPGTDQASSTPVSSSSRKKKKVVITDHVEHGTDKTLMNMVVIGHVDAGKSTIMGHLLYKMKEVDQKEMHKYTKESKEMGKSSFSFAWVMDAHESERERGVTMDVAVKHFETEHKRVAVLDAPGHRDFIPNMIAGAAQADVAVLVVPAPQSEFESAFQRDGQTREHAILVRSFGVQQLIIAVNKMDMCGWSKEQFDAVKSSITEYLLKQSGYQEKNLRFVPLSGLRGENLTKRLPKEVCPWYDGPSLVEAIDTYNPTQRPSDKPLRFPLHDVYKGFGSAVMVAGKLEAGVLEIGDELLIAPSTETCSVKAITSGSLSVTRARAGENIEVTVTDVELNQLLPGFILCSPEKPIPVVERFEARVATLTTMKIPMLQGSRYTMHIHSLDIPVVVVKLTEITDPVKRSKPRHITRGQTAIVEIEASKPVCLELYKDYRPFGRFLLRSRSATDATGMVTSIVRTANSLSKG